MRRRNNTVILLSDDEDDDRSGCSNRSYSKPKSRPLLTLTNPREPKKPRLFGSRSRLSRESSIADEIRFSCEDFDEILSGSKVSTGAEKSNIKELWIDKYKPRSLEELSVHKKKVEEVKAWFEERLISSKNNFGNHVLVITGQAGVGKSMTIHVLASHFGARVSEWNTPTPTVWQEHIHNSSTGIQYTSKLDEFITFIEKTRKYELFPSSFSMESKPSNILVIDDLPVANGRVSFERLKNCLLLLVRSTRIPTIIVVTDYGKADSGDHTVRRLEELQLSLESAGACKVAFNPITNNAIKKMLTRICRLEQCNVTAKQIDLVAKTSGGDIRHAITSLQLFCVTLDMVRNLSLSNATLSYLDGKEDEINDLVSGFSCLFGRDETLSLFHALGKFLHNKRETEADIVSDQGAFVVREKFSRLPLKMDAPEKVLCQAHGQARPIADFLHENVLDFISDEAVDDTWNVASYFSDTDLLLSSFRGMLPRYNEAEIVLQSAAASVAVRGVLFGNSHPLGSRWHAIRRPRLWQVEQSMLSNQKEMVRRRFIGSSCSNVADVCTEYTPVLKWLGNKMASEDDHDEGSERMNLDEEESGISDDEIEDW